MLATGDYMKQSRGPKSKPLAAHSIPQPYFGQHEDKHFWWRRWAQEHVPPSPGNSSPSPRAGFPRCSTPAHLAERVDWDEAVHTVCLRTQTLPFRGNLTLLIFWYLVKSIHTLWKRSVWGFLVVKIQRIHVWTESSLMRFYPNLFASFPSKNIC